MCRHMQGLSCSTQRQTGPEPVRLPTVHGHRVSISLPEARDLSNSVRLRLARQITASRNHSVSFRPLVQTYSASRSAARKATNQISGHISSDDSEPVFQKANHTHAELACPRKCWPTCDYSKAGPQKLIPRPRTAPKSPEDALAQDARSKRRHMLRLHDGARGRRRQCC